MARKHGSDLYALHFPAGQGSVRLAVAIFMRAKPHLAEDVAQPTFINLTAGRCFDELTDGQSLEANRLLKCVADAFARALGHIQLCDILAIEQDAAGKRLFQPGDDARKRGLAAAVGSVTAISLPSSNV